MEENKPLETDTIEEQAPEASENTPVEGVEDVETKEAEGDLSLEDLNKLSGREGDNAFKSREDFEKHYANLKGLVGDQEAVKARKAVEKAEANVEENPTDAVAKELAELKNQLAEKEFIASKPEAKKHLDVVKAYAKANDISIAEAWEKTADNFASRDSKSLTTNNRINPVSSADNAELAKNARTGNSDSQEKLVEAMLGTSKGKL